jgi:phosphatidylserine/phosphatidylglycerophosphate/cardiolipin synthase-like enzyme
MRNILEQFEHVTQMWQTNPNFRFQGPELMCFSPSESSKQLVAGITSVRHVQSQMKSFWGKPSSVEQHFFSLTLKRQPMNNSPEFAHDIGADRMFEKAEVMPSLQLVQTTPTGTVGLDAPDLPETHDVWLEMIESAKLTLDIGQFYIINKRADDPGDGSGRLAPILAAIKAAASRGVRVRFVIDATFARDYVDD